MLTDTEIKDIVKRVNANRCWKTPLAIALRLDGDQPYIQVASRGRHNITGEPYDWRGRKWRLSRHMCRSEVVATAFKAVLTAVEHEVRELFLYKGQAIYDGHMDVEKLVALKRGGEASDFRTEQGAEEFEVVA